MINRRSLITGLISFVAAPAIVRASNLMHVKVIQPPSIKDYSDLLFKQNLINIQHAGIDFGRLDMSAFYISHLEGGKVKIKNIPPEKFYKILDSYDE